MAAGLAAQGITSLPLVGTGGVAATASAPLIQLKSQLELFVGNTPPTCMQQGLVDFLNAAMRQVNRIKGKSVLLLLCRPVCSSGLLLFYMVMVRILLLTGEGDAVTGARLSNKFAFVTFR